MFNAVPLPGTEVLLPNPRPLVFRHGVCKRWRGESWHYEGGGGLRTWKTQTPMTHDTSLTTVLALLPPLSGPCLLRGTRLFLWSGDSLSAGLPALGAQCGLQGPEGEVVAGVGWGNGVKLRLQVFCRTFKHVHK